MTSIGGLNSNSQTQKGGTIVPKTTGAPVQKKVKEGSIDTFNSSFKEMSDDNPNGMAVSLKNFSSNELVETSFKDFAKRIKNDIQYNSKKTKLLQLEKAAFEGLAAGTISSKEMKETVYDPTGVLNYRSYGDQSEFLEEVGKTESQGLQELATAYTKDAAFKKLEKEVLNLDEKDFTKFISNENNSAGDLNGLASSLRQIGNGLSTAVKTTGIEDKQLTGIIDKTQEKLAALKQHMTNLRKEAVGGEKDSKKAFNNLSSISERSPAQDLAFSALNSTNNRLKGLEGADFSANGTQEELQEKLSLIQVKLGGLNQSRETLNEMGLDTKELQAKIAELKQNRDAIQSALTPMTDNQKLFEQIARYREDTSSGYS
jgi:hypothetical protein